ncbi:hypothetical protein HMI55_003540 [Coelomomyces lativittatus]|nr:hypothetical protein HMI55_003540 [Coelomomyces lativittatus]
MASSSNLLLDTLSSLPVFQKLSASVLHTFMTYFEKVKLQEGETLVTEGQIQDLFGIIEEGELHGIKRHEEQQGGHGQKHSLISHPKEIVFLPGHVFGLDHLKKGSSFSLPFISSLF